MLQRNFDFVPSTNSVHATYKIPKNVKGAVSPIYVILASAEMMYMIYIRGSKFFVPPIVRKFISTLENY